MNTVAINTSSNPYPRWEISPWALSEKFLFLVDQKGKEIDADTKKEYIEEAEKLSQGNTPITHKALEKIIKQIRKEEEAYKAAWGNSSQFHSILGDIAGLLEGIKNELDNSVGYIEDTEKTISISPKKTLPIEEINLLLKDDTIQRYQASLSQKHFSLDINGFDYFYYKIVNPNPEINGNGGYTRVFAVWSKGNIQRRAYLSIHLPIEPNQKIDISNIGRISLSKNKLIHHDPIIDSHFMAPEFIQYPTTKDIKKEVQEKYQQSLNAQNTYINFGENIGKNIALEIDGFEFFHIQPISNNTDVGSSFQQGLIPVKVSFKRKKGGGHKEEGKKEEVVNTIIRISPLIGNDPKLLNIDPIYIDNKIASLNIFKSNDSFIVKNYSLITPPEEHDSLSEPPIETNTGWNFFPKKNIGKIGVSNSPKTPEATEKSSTTGERQGIISSVKTVARKAWGGVRKFLGI